MTEILLNSTRLDSVFDVDNSGNYFHGIYYQFVWQNSSGRLKYHENGTIIVDSWWQYISFFQVTIPFLSAKEENLISDFVNLKIENSVNEEFQVLKNKTNIQQLLNLWKNYFSKLKKLRLKKKIKNENEIIKELGRIWWKAYSKSIEQGVKISKEQFKKLSINEKIYIKAWLRGIKILQHSNYHITESYMIYGLNSLPPRVLNEQDVIGNITDFSSKQNRYLKGLELSKYFKKFPLWSSKWIFQYLLGFLLV
eukprot:gene1031-9935_t